MNLNGIKYLLLIIVIFIAACIETDIYLPAFPDMMLAFGVSEEVIQSLLTWNFVGICLAGPLYGPVSDSFGRKKPLIIALGLFLLGSLITVFAQTFEQMLLGRLLQGLGSGGCFTLGTAILIYLRSSCSFILLGVTGRSRFISLKGWSFFRTSKGSRQV